MLQTTNCSCLCSCLKGFLCCYPFSSLCYKVSVSGFLYPVLFGCYKPLQCNCCYLVVSFDVFLVEKIVVFRNEIWVLLSWIEEGLGSWEEAIRRDWRLSWVWGLWICTDMAFGCFCNLWCFQILYILLVFSLLGGMAAAKVMLIGSNVSLSVDDVEANFGKKSYYILENLISSVHCIWENGLMQNEPSTSSL